MLQDEEQYKISCPWFHLASLTRTADKFSLSECGRGRLRDVWRTLEELWIRAYHSGNRGLQDMSTIDHPHGQLLAIKQASFTAMTQNYGNI